MCIRDSLYISYAQTRMLHGYTRYGMRSRFLDELPEHTTKWLSPKDSGYAPPSGGQTAALLVRGGVWLHATSVGEYEQARPILRRLRELGVGPLVVTHFSPSGREYAASHPEADVHDYLPLDRPADVRELMAAWKPRALVFVKYDCWPNLVVAAGDAGVPVLLLSGALPPGSLRRHPLLRPFYRDLFDRFARLRRRAAPADRHVLHLLSDPSRLLAALLIGNLLVNIGVSAPVVVSGDTRAEQVLLRYDAAAASTAASASRASCRITTRPCSTSTTASARRPASGQPSTRSPTTTGWRAAWSSTCPICARSGGRA